MKHNATVLTMLLTLGIQSLFAKMEHREFFAEWANRSHLSTEQNIYKSLKEYPLECDVACLQAPWNYLINRADRRGVSASGFGGVQLKNGFTVTGHGNHKGMVPLVSRLGVRTLFTPQGDYQVHHGVLCVPILFYSGNSAPPAEKKNILYSFVGYDSHKTRRQIFSMRWPQDALVKKRSTYHLWQKPGKREQERREYQNILSRTRFGLCPAGVHPNTSRFTELLEAGAVPIVISDKVKFPEWQGVWDEEAQHFHFSAGADGEEVVSWKDCIVRISERNVKSIDAEIRKISEEREQYMRTNCLRLYQTLVQDPAFFIRYHFAKHPPK